MNVCRSVCFGQDSVMSVGSVSFWQQDQNYRNQQQSKSNYLAAQTSIINAIGSAETNLGKGLASIANQAALDRVNSQLTSEIQKLLNPNATSTGSSTGTSSGTGTAATPAVPATATGTAPVTTSTTLASLGIYAGGSITVSAGGNTTTYASTGSDTIGDLMTAINQNYVGNAAVTASLNRNGDLVFTSKNTTDTITVGGVYAGNIGFGVGNNTFKPTPGTAGSSASSTTGTSGNSSTSSSSSSSTSSSQSTVSLASENLSSAASILSTSGVSGSLVDMLA
jgi:hypothetical protein